MSDTATATKSGVGSSSGPDPLIGRVIAERFKITQLIARGGMGKVYCAEQAPLGRTCAVKILNPNYTGDADPEFHQRFSREASITSKITHPNSVTIFDYGKTEDDIYYMAMELLEGQTLHQGLREVGTMREDRVGRIASQICRALREAHSLDVIHRDLKPANIFLTRHGDDEDFVKVLDFGLVKHLSERPEEQLTQTGLFMGSPKYMAPEQIQGSAVDARTDIYSLGIIMYEMLAGKVPFERATSVNILMAHVGEPPPPMREVNPNLVCSPAFEELVMRCISKNPAHRYRSMEEVLHAIRLAHGGAMTGQLSAIGMNGVYGTSPPASGPAHSPLPSSVHGMHASAHASGSVTPTVSGSHTPGPLLVSDAQGDSSPYGSAYRPRSKAWIGLGVVVAAVVGGLLGMVAFRMTASVPIASETVPSSLSVAAAPGTNVGGLVGQEPASSPTAVSGVSSAVPTSVVAADVRAVDTRAVTLRVTSDPPGASVREDDAELCASTPCDLAFKGDAADPAKVHKLVVTKVGYRVETKSVKAQGAPVSVKLARLPAGAGGAPVRSAPAAAPKPAGDAPGSNANGNGNGFKDLPY